MNIYVWIGLKTLDPIYVYLLMIFSLQESSKKFLAKYWHADYPIKANKSSNLLDFTRVWKILTSWRTPSVLVLHFVDFVRQRSLVLIFEKKKQIENQNVRNRERTFSKREIEWRNKSIFEVIQKVIDVVMAWGGSDQIVYKSNEENIGKIYFKGPMVCGY